MQHQELAAGRWFTLSLPEQLAHIGSEIHRASRWHGRDTALFESAVARALELFDLTISDRRWRARLKEVARARELFCRIVFHTPAYGTTLADLDAYFFRFALLARQQR
ncbi:MAG: Uncharacterized protein G01um1014106_424 [Parcubacteria group bacterium Gr01-1014_106]|nr:MAG: Uncharacterized protein G01um1014106_424 [Parcubacteria group bacterium Gr01-1014_106]